LALRFAAGKRLDARHWTEDRHYIPIVLDRGERVLGVG